MRASQPWYEVGWSIVFRLVRASFTALEDYQRLIRRRIIWDWSWWGRKLLRVPWTSGRSNQPILKEINPEYSLEGLMLNLKLQYFGHMMWRADSSEKTLMLQKIEGRRRSVWQRMRWLDSITDSVEMNLSKFWETVKARKAWCAAVHGVTQSRTWLCSWTTTYRERRHHRQNEPHIVEFRRPRESYWKNKKYKIGTCRKYGLQKR